MMKKPRWILIIEGSVYLPLLYSEVIHDKSVNFPTSNTDTIFSSLKL